MNPVLATVLGSLAGAAVLVAAALLVRVLLQLQALIRRLERSAEYIEARQPQVDRLLDGLEAELAELRGVTEKANRIASTVDGVTGELGAALQPAVRQVGNLAQGLRALRAASDKALGQGKDALAKAAAEARDAFRREQDRG
ncbi:hypothetical protein FJ251_01455 [bacterium]|nr:hypothetical protein [bacterium]